MRSSATGLPSPRLSARDATAEAITDYYASLVGG